MSSSNFVFRSILVGLAMVVLGCGEAAKKATAGNGGASPNGGTAGRGGATGGSRGGTGGADSFGGADGSAGVTGHDAPMGGGDGGTVGGNPATGGIAGAGGGQPSGGASSPGGQVGGKGGMSAAGGTAGEAGGRTGTGGSGSGGLPGSGGSTGGIAGSGGTSSSGGVPATGGAPTSGGTSGSGGIPAGGGTSGTGGVPTTGGVPATGGGGGSTANGTVALTWDFATTTEGWAGDFSDYPPNIGTGYDLTYRWSALPAEVGPGGGLFMSGNNHSDDLFMYIKRQITGLTPGASYLLDVSVTLDSNAPATCGGIGGSPGESVFVKIGSVPFEPTASLDASDHLVLNLDKGNQSVGGVDMKVVGTISNTLPCPSAPYQAKTLKLAGFSARTASDGTLWIAIGTDSGFEGVTTLYYDRIVATLTPSH